MAQLNPLEIVKKLPQTNCGKCGYPSCLAFAMALITGSTSPERCPEAKLDDLKVTPQSKAFDEDYHWRILEEVQKRARELDWRILPESTGGKLVASGLELPYLDTLVVISPEKALRRDGKELDPRDQILLYNYLIQARPEHLSGEFVGLESFPSSLSKVQTLRRYAEEKIAQAFSGRISLLKRVLGRFRINFPQDCPADLCVVLWVLPKVPLRLQLFEAEPEEGLSAEAKILFDRRALSFLDLESLVFCAERVVERLLEICEEGD